MALAEDARPHAQARRCLCNGPDGLLEDAPSGAVTGRDWPRLTNHVLRDVSLSPILHRYRLQRTREVLPPLLWSPSRPTVADLMARSIFRTHTSVVSRRLARSLVSIRLSRSLASRPPVEALVERCVLPKECVPGLSSVHISPGLVAKRKAIEREKVKDGLRRWIGGKWMGEVRHREQELRRWYETRGVGRVWKLTKFWEQMSRGDDALIRSLRSRNDG
ncbi:hypothetical protein E4U53_002787 [Claviceps sorghi]|nr:hypothetical protein E4U53_002787 [Claviceps sorghi]